VVLVVVVLLLLLLLVVVVVVIVIVIVSIVVAVVVIIVVVLTVVAIVQIVWPSLQTEFHCDDTQFLFPCRLFPVAVLRKVITGAAGDTVITVDGTVEFKETIKVTKNNAKPQETLDDYLVEVGIHKTQ
jgi:hypothetical protein